MVDPIMSFEDIAHLLRQGETDWHKYGHVNVAYSQDGDLALFNYTSAAQWSNEWNWFEQVSRGLIFQTTGELVALPFPKFWNYGEGGRLPQSPVVEVTEKWDGSLGIIFNFRGQWRVATRGSFNSEQAQWGASYLDLLDMWLVNPKMTLLAEIVYPGNRIVVDYGGMEGLVVVGARNRESYSDEFSRYWSTLARRMGLLYANARRRSASELDAKEYLDMAAHATIHQGEGWVVRCLDGVRFKIKIAEYVRLHRLMGTCTPKNVWSALVARNYEEIYKDADPMVATLARGYADVIRREAEALWGRASAAYFNAPAPFGIKLQIDGWLRDKSLRKDFAIWARGQHPDIAHLLFAMLDNKDVYNMALRDIGKRLGELFQDDGGPDDPADMA